MWICFAAEIKRIHIGDRGCGQHSFILCAELICAHGQNREKALFLPQGQPIDGNLGTSQLHCDVALQFLELLHAFGFQLDKHRAVEERLFVFAEVGEKFNYILQIALRLNAFADIVAATFESVTACGILNDLALFHRFHQPVIDAERNAIAVGKLRENGLFLSGRRIFPNRPHAAVAVADDIMVG